MIKIKRALISVFDKSGLEIIADFCVRHKVEVVSSGGTAGRLKELGVSVTTVSTLTQFPEMLDGRVKTLHPRVHGGILARRTHEHLQQLKENEIEPIDLVVANLYPFEAVKEKTDEWAELIENIDIGGPTLLRAAAKNHENVCVLSSPEWYKEFVELYGMHDGIPEETARRWAIKTFSYTGYYDALIARTLSAVAGMNAMTELPWFPLPLKQKAQLRYGENPAQEAAVYVEAAAGKTDLNVVNCEQLWGKELSFNNYIDLSSALEMTLDFSEPFACILKHTNPCGAAIGDSITDAFMKAHSTDPKSAFGGIIGVNRRVEADVAQKIIGSFFECVVAPGYTDDALEILRKKKNIRLLKWNEALRQEIKDKFDFKKISGGLLIQQRDTHFEKVMDWELKCGEGHSHTVELDFAWKMVKHVKSNAIILVKNGQLIGVGAGQMSRVDSVEIALKKAQEFGFDTHGAILASDAFFPFADSIESAAAHGIRVFIEPGGSIRDDQVIEKAQELKVTLYFTGYRHFKH